MKHFSIPLLAGAVLLSAPLASSADRDKAESGQQHRYMYKEAYWDGHCKVERRFSHDGEYKEERKCRAPLAYAPVVAVPVHAPQPAVVVHPSPGVAIHGSVRIR